MTSENFISEFHNIEGVSVGDRKRNVHKLLKNKDVIGDEEQLILDNLTPKTFLETLMYIDVLIYLRKTVQLLEILKNGNEACVSKIVKQSWFFKEAFNNVGADEFVDEILPSMSFSVKLKVLKRVLVVFPEKKMDEVFDAVSKRYGLFIATTVIPACSSQKIEYILKNYEVRLWSSQLKIIHKKQPDLIKIYLEVHKQQQSESIFDKNFLIYLAQNDPALFWYIIENHEMKDNLKLGRRTTKKLIETKRHEVVSTPKKYIRYFRHETLVRNLNKLGEFKQFYHNLFPRDLEKLDNENILCKKLLKYYPKHSQYQLYTETFSSVLNENILSNLNCLNDFFLKSIADVELRETIAQLKYNETSDDEYITYYKPERSFTLIKEKINVTASINERKKLLCILIKSCAVNNDLKLLEKVLQYICERHRNVDKNTRASFMDTIESNFKLEDFGETHWKCLNKIFTIQCLKNEFPYRPKLIMNYIKYLCKNNRSEDDINYAILEYLKYIIVTRTSFYLLSDIKDDEVEKKILMQAVEHFPTLIKTQKVERQLRHYVLSEMIAEILSYNIRYPKNKIMIFETLVEILRNIFKTNEYVYYAFHQNLAKVLCKLNRNDLENEMLNYYWEKVLPQNDGNRVISWFLKYDPMVIVENMDKIFKAPSYSASNIWHKIKSYSHLDLDNIIVKHSLERLKEDEYESIKRLSILAAPEYYIKIMESNNFIPTSPKLVIEDQEAKEIYRVQQIFLKYLKNLKDPLKYLPMLIDTFCQGDYLQSSLIALYSAFYNCPENELKLYLNKLAKNPAISVKKHALNLACSVFEQKTIFEILNDLENEKNISLQKCTFLSCLKYFSKNPIEELFEKVLFHMTFLREQDKESLNILYKVNIPRNYKPFYIQHILKLAEKFKDNDKEGKIVEFNNAISSILDLIDKHCIQKLPEDFCKEIIQKYFLKNEEIHGIFPFVIKLLLYRDEKISNFDFVFKLLSSYKLQNWHNCSIKERENMYKFFETFYINACEKEVALDFVEQFSSNWKKIFTPVETFEEYILLNLLHFKKVSEDNLETFSEKIVLFSEELAEEFGQIVLSKFVTVLAKSFNNCKPRARINLLSNMLKFKITPLNCILVIELIVAKQDLFYKDKIRHTYRDIDSILKEVSDPNVRLFYNLYLKK